MARTETSADVLSWLKRGRREELQVEDVVLAIRSVRGVVPLGGRVGGVDGTTPPATPKNSALALFSADKDAKTTADATDTQDKEKEWGFLLTSVQLPASGDRQELRKSLQKLQEEETNKKLEIDQLRSRFFSERRDFFAVRVELLRTARNPEHPNAQAAEEVVDELLKEGLREALLDEVHGRQFCQPPRFSSVGDKEREALVDWELQVLEEEALLRELLLLTLVASREKSTLETAVKIAKTVHNWEVRVFDEVFTANTLALPVAQEAARKLTQVGVLVALRLLHSTGAVQELGALQQATKNFFLTDLCGVPDAMSEESMTSPVPGVLLLAWATLLGRQYHNVSEFSRGTGEVQELETMLQQTLTASERLHSFHYLNALLRSLVFGSDYADSDSNTAMLHPLSLHAKKLWVLPNIAASSGLRGTNTTQAQYGFCSGSTPIYQFVVASFVNDMLSSLGYMENLDGAEQLHGMVRFVLPSLSSTRVAMQTLGLDVEDSDMTDIVATGESVALRDLLAKIRANLPHSLLSCVQMFTSLCCNYQDTSSPVVLRQVLKYFSKPRAGLEDRVITSGVCRPAPPSEYFSEVSGEPGQVQCTRSFAYDEADTRLVVPAGTIGAIIQSDDDVQIEWLLSTSDEGKNAPSIWDLLMLRAESFVAGFHSGSFTGPQCSNADDVIVLTAFFEFIVQLGRQQDGGQFVLEEMMHCWGEARLRYWWNEHSLPSPEVYVPQLIRQQVSLPLLLSASRENLVSWGIWDRHTRERVLAQLGNAGPCDFGTTASNDSTMGLFQVDGGTHLLRLLLGALDGFLNASPLDGEDAWSPAYLHLITASFISLRTLLSATSVVELLMNPSLGGGREECVNLIAKTAKKLFEFQERLTGEYPVVLATQDIFMSVVRWFLSKEAHTLAKSTSEKEFSVGSPGFIAMERLWFVSATEFAIEVLTTHESWKFVFISERCEVLERCFRLLYVLAFPRKYIHVLNDMVPAFEAALRSTLSTDMSLLMKLLRSSCAVLSSVEGHVGNWNSIVSNEDEGSSSDSDGHFPLLYKRESELTGVSMTQLESLVTTCLRVVALLITNEKNAANVQAARKVLLTPIDDGGPKNQKSLTIVTLCGGYIGYSLEKAPGIAYWSLQILHCAAAVLDYRQERENCDVSSMHSLVALFHGYQDLPLVRGTFAQLLRASSPQQLSLRKEIIEMLTLCLEHQPGFLALLLFGNASKNGEDADVGKKAEGDPLPFVALLERFFEASEKLLEQSSDLFCALLTFLVQVWKGAIHNGLGVHIKIIAELRARPTFWSNVTRALKIHMPVESVEERGLLDLELDVATAHGRGPVESPSSSLEAYLGRSSAYGYLARGLILQLVSYEWHNQASKESSHPLVDVLESFRKEGLYSHWLRTFTRLDYSPTQLEQYAASIPHACNQSMLTSNLLSDIPIGSISVYLEGLICNASGLKWQLSAGGDFKAQASAEDVRALKLIQWSNLQAAYLNAQLFSLAKWKVFMELCCLQAGGGESTEKTNEQTTPRPLKRKESMISSPPRTMSSTGSSNASRARLTLSSVSSSDSSLSSSRFSGDRTSFGMIQVLADVIKIRVKQHENQDETLDYFVLLHLNDLVQLLVSMLHHQLCLVVRKTRDPKLSQTRQRLEGSSADPNLKLNAVTTLELLAVIEKTASAVHDSIDQISRELKQVRGVDSKTMSAPSEWTAAPLVAHFVTDFEKKTESVADGLYTSLFTAALLLVRHLSKISDHSSGAIDGDADMESTAPPKPLLQVKLIGHCMNAIRLCDDRSQPTAPTQALFQLSWCLFQEVLDGFSSVDSSVVSKPKLRMANAVQLNPFITELEHEQQGIGALFHLLVQRFRPSSYSKEVAAKQEEACQILRGLNTVVWNPTNAELCQRVMLKENTPRSPLKLRLISMVATDLLPLLQAHMGREETTSKLRGYASFATDMEETEALDRSLAHRMWCLVLDFVAGLLRLPSGIDSDNADVWDFMSHAEALMLRAVEPTTCQRLTRAVTAEHQALLRLLSALSSSSSRRKRWRQAFPSNAVVLMEQSRQLLRRACVLLGSSSAELTRLRKERAQKQKQPKSPSSKAIVGFGASLTPKSPRSPRSPSSFTYAHQTLLFDHLQAVRAAEKSKLTVFHQEMETELVEVVRLSSLLLTKWTSSLADRDAILVVDGVRCVDEEQLVPLLAFLPPSESCSMSSDPGLGHLTLAMDFMLDQLLDEEQTGKTKAVLANAIDTCALLFLKTYLLHAELYELGKRDHNELHQFFRQFNARLSKDDSAESTGVDVQLLEYIDKVCSV
ncbi:hypothetical protein P3T76_009880 [Phytophthora citrophthora]|uniref:Uncharacterized protein n=1 Tax=Phytophthora citrophthora TaxID=4793 RepID=A0AAD9LIP6_9STRA|nr:hypothetical protein P3T76_009880 [Phytophthora citrophthora]